MELINKNEKIFKPMCDILDKCNINNCIYLGDNSLDNEHHLFIDTTKLSYVNQQILYVMTTVYTDRFVYGNNLVDDMSMYSNVSKKDFANYRYVCFKIPRFESCFDDYTIGFFLEFANCFVKQEPFPVLENIYTKEEIERYNEYYRSGREDFQDICMTSTLGIDHPLRSNPNNVKATAKRFFDGQLVNSNKNSFKCINKNFTLTPTRALTNYNKYLFAKKKEEEVAKQKAKTPNNG